MTPEYLNYRVMKEMGWTYEELMITPAHVVQEIIRFMNTEGKFYQDKMRQHGRG